MLLAVPAAAMIPTGAAWSQPPRSPSSKQAPTPTPSASELYQRALKVIETGKRGDTTRLSNVDSISLQYRETWSGPDWALPKSLTKLGQRFVTIEWTRDWYAEWMALGHASGLKYAHRVEVLDRNAGVAWVGSRVADEEMRYELLGRTETEALAKRATLDLVVLALLPPGPGAVVRPVDEGWPARKCWVVEDSDGQQKREIFFDSDGSLLRVRKPGFERRYGRFESWIAFPLTLCSGSFTEYYLAPRGADGQPIAPGDPAAQIPVKVTLDISLADVRGTPFESSCFEIPESLVSQLPAKGKQVYEQRQAERARQAAEREDQARQQQADIKRKLDAAEAQKRAEREAKQASSERKLTLSAPRGPAMKGLRLGELRSGHPAEARLRVAPEHVSADSTGSPSPFAAVRLSVDGRFKEIFIPKATFDAESMPLEQFARNIMESYDIPKLEPYGNRYQYINAAEGWSVSVGGSGVMLNALTPSAGKFD